MTSQRKVLVVDDEDRLRAVLCRTMRKDGYETREAASGEDAIVAMQSERPDLVLLDIHMDGISGLDVLGWIRQRHSSFELPVMVVSGGGGALVVQALDAGANDFIGKPFNFEVLAAKVRVHLERSAAGVQRSLLDTVPGARHTGSRRSTGSRPARVRTSRRSVAPAALLSSRYEIDRSIGEGAFGRVFSGHHTRLDRPVAIKMMRGHVRRTADEMAAFQREGAIACRLDHPNAVRVYDCGIAANGTPYLVMELLQGQPLQDELVACGRLDEQRACELMAPVASCVAAAHACGILHHDLKPANIFVHRDGDREIVKVVDFGTAELDAALSGSAAVARTTGTPAYMAPERFSGDQVGPAADVYSLGCVLYHLLSGELPFTAADDVAAVAMAHCFDQPPPLDTKAPRTSRALVELVHACLAKEPSARPDAAALEAGLRAEQTGDPA